MKKTLLVGICMCLAVQVQAQLQKGATYLGGTIGLSGTSTKSSVVNNNETNRTKRFSISPEVQYGYFLDETTVVGVGLKYTAASATTIVEQSNQETSSLNQSAQILPFVRKYKALNNRWSVFLHAQIGPGYNIYRSKVNGVVNDNTKTKYWQYDLNVKPGVVYNFPRTGWALEAYADVLSLNAQYVSPPKSPLRSFSLSSGLKTDFPSYFTIRIAKYISTASK